MNKENKNYNILSEVQEVDENLYDLMKIQKLPSNPVHRDEDKMLQSIKDISSEVSDRIVEQSLITPKDIKGLKKAQPFLLSTYTDVPQFRTLIDKMQIVATASRFPSPESQYWQCKKEAEVHYNEMQRELFKLERAHIDINELDYKINSIEQLLEGDITTGEDTKLDPNLVSFDLQRLKLKRNQYFFELKQLEKTIKYRIKEITEWSEICETIEPHCKDTIDPEYDQLELKFKQLEFNLRQAETEEEKIRYQRKIQILVKMFGNNSAYERAKEKVEKYISSKNDDDD